LSGSDVFEGVIAGRKEAFPYLLRIAGWRGRTHFEKNR
jgi:hypothetical protein